MQPLSPSERKRRRWLRYGLPLLLACFAANHLEYYYRQKRVAARTPSAVVVKAEGNLFAGHNTLGIDESRTAPVDGQFLRFSTLGQWEFDPKTPSPCPEGIRRLSGREALCLGFMYPLEPGGRLKTFCLLRTTQTCCYGPRPQWSQYLLVEMKDPVKFERLAPVTVRGVFYADPQPAQGFIYRLEGKDVHAVSDDTPDVDPVEATSKAKLPLVDFAVLEAAENSKAIPPQLQALNGKGAVVAGYFMNRSETGAPRLLVGKYWWDGVSRGKPPGICNAILVRPRDAAQLPPAWKDKGLFTGTLRIEPDADKWAQNGIACLQDAVLGVPGVAGSALAIDRGPILVIWEEALILAIFLYFSVWRSRPSCQPISVVCPGISSARP